MSSRGRRKMHMPRVQPLTPLMEGPYLNSESEDDQWKKKKKNKKKEMSWVTFRALVGIRKDKDLLPMRLNLKLMLGVLACPLAPIPLPLQPSYFHFSIKDSPTESTCARYIVHQYLAATGWMRKREKKMKSLYVSGKVKMVGCESVSTMGRNGRMVVEDERSGGGESGCFVLWKMSTAMWLVEMVVEGCKVVAGSDGKVIWRHLPWSGTHLARGPLRPLRRIVQGLDPNMTASMFAKAQCVGEKIVGNDDCFVLKVCTDREAIEERNEASAEVIRHVLYGYFSQRSGLLIYIEDSHLTRVQSPAMETVYWETTFGSSIEDYREVDGVLIAHRGTSTATVFRFGEARDIHSRTKMEETWRIDDVVFDVPGLSCDCFIPPTDVLN